MIWIMLRTRDGLMTKWMFSEIRVNEKIFSSTQQSALDLVPHCDEPAFPFQFLILPILCMLIGDQSLILLRLEEGGISLQTGFALVLV